MWTTSLSPKNIEEYYTFIDDITLDEQDILQALGSYLSYDDLFKDTKFKLSLGGDHYVELPSIFKDIFIPLFSNNKSLSTISRLIINIDIADHLVEAKKDISYIFRNKKLEKDIIGLKYLLCYIFAFLAFSSNTLKNSEINYNTKINIFTTEDFIENPFITLSSSDLGEFIEGFFSSLKFTPKKLFIAELCNEYLENNIEKYV